MTEPRTFAEQTEFSIERWETLDSFVVCLEITNEEDVVTAVAVNLPGAGSQGSDRIEAIANAKEAVKGVIESYQFAGEEIPWKNITGYKAPEGSKLVWVNVNA